MSTFLEYDRTNLKIVRIITADELPFRVAHLEYIQVPEGVEIDLSMKITDVMQAIKDDRASMSKESTPVKAANNKAETPQFMEM